MFSYISLGTRDLARAIVFYDAALAPLGQAGIVGFDPEGTSAAWGLDDPGPHLWVTEPFDGNPASVGNGVMVSFLAATCAAVDAFHAAALAHGGSDEGATGRERRLAIGSTALWHVGTIFSLAESPPTMAPSSVHAREESDHAECGVEAGAGSDRRTYDVT